MIELRTRVQSDQCGRIRQRCLFRGIGKLKPDELEIERREVEKGYGERHDGQGHRGGKVRPISYPLIIKHLWHAPLLQAADQEIVYRDLSASLTASSGGGSARLASRLQRIGVRPGDTVGVLDWDSNRFLEAFFAVPMMGAVLQTVNVRLPPEQVAYTIDHAGSSVLLVNDEFVPLLRGLMPQLSKVKKLVVMSDRSVPQTGSLSFERRVRGSAGCVIAGLPLSGLRREYPGNHLLHVRHNGPAQRVYYSHRQVVLHCLSELAFLGVAGKHGRFSRDDVYMPMTPMFPMCTPGDFRGRRRLPA